MTTDDVTKIVDERGELLAACKLFKLWIMSDKSDNYLLLKVDDAISDAIANCHNGGVQND